VPVCELAGIDNVAHRLTSAGARRRNACDVEQVNQAVQVDGKWVQKYKRDPDPQSPAGGVSSSVNDLAKWMRLQLANGQFEGKRMVDENALAETHSPQIFMWFDPLNGLPMFYGLGWFVGYDKEGRLHRWHTLQGDGTFKRRSAEDK